MSAKEIARKRREIAALEEEIRALEDSEGYALEQELYSAKEFFEEGVGRYVSNMDYAYFRVAPSPKNVEEAWEIARFWYDVSVGRETLPIPYEHPYGNEPRENKNAPPLTDS
jgi:hypothetical protein